MLDLKKLRDFAAEVLEKAESKQDIERATKLNSLVEETEKEAQKVNDENKEYLQMVKELAKHTTFKEAPKEPTNSGPKSFDEQLADFVKSEKEKAKK